MDNEHLTVGLRKEAVQSVLQGQCGAEAARWSPPEPAQKILDAQLFFLIWSIFAFSACIWNVSQKWKYHIFKNEETFEYISWEIFFFLPFKKKHSWSESYIKHLQYRIKTVTLGKTYTCVFIWSFKSKRSHSLPAGGSDATRHCCLTLLGTQEENFRH